MLGISYTISLRQFSNLLASTCLLHAAFFLGLTRLKLPKKLLRLDLLSSVLSTGYASSSAAFSLPLRNIDFDWSQNVACICLFSLISLSSFNFNVAADSNSFSLLQGLILRVEHSADVLSLSKNSSIYIIL